jgi:predicted nucleic acid-binding protein
MSPARIFADTNILLDWLGRREPFFRHAEALFMLAEAGEIEVLISPMSYLTAEYILRKQLGRERTLQALSGIRSISTVCAAGSNEIDLALVSGMQDFEDAFQYYTALSNSASVIITRNERDFTGAAVPVMNAEAYLKSIRRA